MISPWKDLFLLFKEERRQLLVFLVLLIFILVAKWTIPYWFPEDESFLKEMNLVLNEAEKESIIEKNFQSSILSKVDVNTDDTVSWMTLGFSRRQSEIIINYKNLIDGFDSIPELKKVFIINDEDYNAIRKKLVITKSKVIEQQLDTGRFIREQITSEIVELAPFSFDPNLVSEADLSAIGLKKNQIKNLINYRNKGGHFYNKTDVQKLYSIGQSDFEILEPYIEIAPVKTKNSESENFRHTNTFNINSCDSLDLISIKGIGPYYAHLILKYRTNLGGFYSVEQLHDIKKLPKETIVSSLPFLKLEENPKLKKINLNSENFKSFLKHPYFDYYHTKKIFEFKNKHGKFTSLRDLNEVGFIEPDYVEKITHYLKIKSD